MRFVRQEASMVRGFLLFWRVSQATVTQIIVVNPSKIGGLDVNILFSIKQQSRKLLYQLCFSLFYPYVSG